ncbi:hypothetical protein ABT097_29205 [Streptomyces sp. NPDC002225]|uniref:hypothetical protein n=1 Tax=Streptomyces sp. NPDC002225 TaxID=3154413 RepID=UPI0033197F22
MPGRRKLGAAPAPAPVEGREREPWTPDSRDSSHAGTLYAGTNYVYCFTNGENYTDKGHTSTIWLQTDDDSGNPNV